MDDAAGLMASDVVGSGTAPHSTLLVLRDGGHCRRRYCPFAMGNAAAYDKRDKHKATKNKCVGSLEDCEIP